MESRRRKQLSADREVGETSPEARHVRAFSFPEVEMARVRLFAIWLVCVLCVVLAVPWMLVSILVGSPRAWTFAKGFDRVGNVIAGGVDDEYLSARAQRVRKEGRRWACVLCRLLDKVDPGHCDKY